MPVILWSSNMNAYLDMIAKQDSILARAEEHAENLIVAHIGIDSARRWRFVWNTRVRALGTCNYRKREIALSKQWTLATPWEEIDDTLRREIAHAIAGYKAGHGPVWKKAALRVGASPETTYSGPVSTRDVHVAKYEMIDTTTGKVVKSYYRKPTAKTYKQVERMYMKGRREETQGKLVINPVDLIKELDL